MIACKIFEVRSPFDGLSKLTGNETSFSVLQSLAKTLSFDSRFKSIHFVLRQPSAKETALFALGDLSPSMIEQLIQLSRQLMRINRRARFVDYKEAERLSGVLAKKLIARYGREEIATYDFRPIPRGGHIIYGLLTYQLGLSRSEIQSGSDDPDRPIIFIDDCMLSGMRAKEYLQKENNHPCIVATLFAPSHICQNSSSETYPFDCVCAEELEDMAPDLYGDTYVQWKEKWDDIYGDSVLWTGQPEYIAFSWNEPESAFYNSHTGKIEQGFKLISPDRCLNNRKPFQSELTPTILHKDGPGPYNAPPHIVAAQIGEYEIALANFESISSNESAKCFLLEGSAVEMWKALMKHGEIEKATEELSLIFDIDSTVIFQDLTSFIESLEGLGLIINGH